MQIVISPRLQLVSLTIIPQKKMRTFAKPRQHIPYVNKTPPPKLCRSKKEIVCAAFASFRRNLSVLQVEALRIPPS